MVQKIINFIKYNNAFPIGMMILFLGAGMTVAASPALRDSVYSSSEIVTSVDNRLIVSADLDHFNFNLKINSVTEDIKNYYIKYNYNTLTIENSVWVKVSPEKTLTVNKASIQGKDLGLYVARELGDNINYELSYLKKVQDLQKGIGISKKVVTVEYAGLVGKFIDPEEKVIDGYNPLIPEVATEVASVPEKAVAPDPSLFIENYPGYVKPPLNNPKPTPEVDEYAIRKIVEQMLSTQPAPAPALESETVPEPEAEPQPEAGQLIESEDSSESERPSAEEAESEPVVEEDTTTLPGAPVLDEATPEDGQEGEDSDTPSSDEEGAGGGNSEPEPVVEEDTTNPPGAPQSEAGQLIESEDSSESERPSAEAPAL